MISSKEAAAAWIDDIPVEIRYKGTIWMDLSLNERSFNIFKNSNYEFRLKPRTITLNGIEVPAPFEPKDGEYYYHIELGDFCGYKKRGMIAKTCIYSQVGVWRTEEEIKQVVDALRSVFSVK